MASTSTSFTLAMTLLMNTPDEPAVVSNQTTNQTTNQTNDRKKKRPQDLRDFIDQPLDRIVKILRLSNDQLKSKPKVNDEQYIQLISKKVESNSSESNSSESNSDDSDDSNDSDDSDDSERRSDTPSDDETDSDATISGGQDPVASMIQSIVTTLMGDENKPINQMGPLLKKLSEQIKHFGDNNVSTAKMFRNPITRKPELRFEVSYSMVDFLEENGYKLNQLIIPKVTVRDILVSPELKRMLISRYGRNYHACRQKSWVGYFLQFRTNDIIAKLDYTR